MELTCLSCASTFEVDEAVATAGPVKCPACGRQQKVVPRAERPRVDVVVPPQQRDGFRKPLQAFSSFKPNPTVDQPRPQHTTGETRIKTPTSPMRKDTGQSAAQRQTGPTPPSEAETASGTSASERPWVVRSPTGLVLEFPTSQLMASWSAILDNPAPYMVSRGGDDWTSLEEVLREIKLGRRATQVFKRVPVQESGTSEPGAGKDVLVPVAPQQSSMDRQVSQPAPRRTPTTAQFEFKLTKPPQRSERKLLWAGLLFLVAVLGAGAAVLLLKVLG